MCKLRVASSIDYKAKSSFILTIAYRFCFSLNLKTSRRRYVFTDNVGWINQIKQYKFNNSRVANTRCISIHR